MNTYKTYVQCDASGRVVLEGLPFPAGALLEVLVVDQSHRPEERVESWRALMRHVQEFPRRGLPPTNASPRRSRPSGAGDHESIPTYRLDSATLT